MESQTYVTLKSILLSTRPGTQNNLELETPGQDTHLTFLHISYLQESNDKRKPDSHHWIPPSGTDQWSSKEGVALCQLPGHIPGQHGWQLSHHCNHLGDARLHTPMYFFLPKLALVDICFTNVIVPRRLANLLSKGKKDPFAQCHH